MGEETQGGQPVRDGAAVIAPLPGQRAIDFDPKLPDVPETGDRFVITFRSRGSAYPLRPRLAAFLKNALRAFDLVCVEVRTDNQAVNQSTR